jgi:hypothetical protein
MVSSETSPVFSPGSSHLLCINGKPHTFNADGVCTVCLAKQIDIEFNKDGTITADLPISSNIDLTGEVDVGGGTDVTIGVGIKIKF